MSEQKITRPNFTLMPNEFFDSALAEMTFTELRIVLALYRYTGGTPTPVNIVHLCEMAGMSREKGIEGAECAIKRGWVVDAGEGAYGTRLYRLNISKAV